MEREMNARVRVNHLKLLNATNVPYLKLYFAGPENSAFNVTVRLTNFGVILFYADKLRHRPNEPSSPLKIANRAIIKDYSVDLLKC